MHVFFLHIYLSDRFHLGLLNNLESTASHRTLSNVYDGFLILVQEHAIEV